MEEERPERRQVVPKFTSFRPKTTEAPDEAKKGPSKEKDARQEPEARAPERDSSRERHSDKKRHSEHRDRPRRHRHRHRSRSPKRSHREVEKRHSREPEVVSWDDSHDVFIVDTRGDEKNLVYGAIHQYNLPTYFRLGAGNVIGLEKDLKIDRITSNEKAVVIGRRLGAGGGGQERYFDVKTEQKGLKKLRIKSLDGEEAAFDAFEDAHDFIPFHFMRGVKRKHGELHSPTASGDEGHYRSIEGKAKAAKQPQDADLIYASESSASDYEGIGSSWDDATRKRNVELAQRVEGEPNNVEAWLELINHQDTLTRDGSGRRLLTSAERQSTADIKLFMYEKALTKIHDEGRECLLIGMMEEGSKIWDFKKLSNQWQSVLKENPNFMGLWTKYLDFRQTNFATFRYPDGRKVFVECIEALKSAIIDAARCQSAKVTELENILLYVLLRATLFMREAGFVENGTAVWQALLEVHFFTPMDFDLSRSHDQQAQGAIALSLERFWDSEVPRIGEDGAKGWRAFVANGEEGEDPSPQDDGFENPSYKGNIYKLWLKAERTKAFKSRRPAKTVDEVEEDDPFRVILFSDIKEFIVPFASKDTKANLIDAYLAFCRLPPLPSSDNESSSQCWWIDSFVRNEGLEQSDSYCRRWLFDDYTSSAKEKMLPWLAGMEPEYPNPIEEKGPFAFKFRNFPSSVETAFADDIRWFALQERWLDSYPDDTGPVNLDWLRRVLNDLALEDGQGHNMSVYRLSFEWRNFPKGARKVAKTLLKKHRSDLCLYNAYALLEWRLGNKDSATNIFTTAIEMSKSFDERERRNVILLWKSWTWELLLDGDLGGAWHKLLCIPEGKVTSFDTLSTTIEDPIKARPAAFLKTRRDLAAGRDHSLTLGHSLDAVNFIECSAILEYLAHSRDPAAAVSVFDKALEVFHKRNLAGSIPHELLHQAKARLLHAHATTARSFKPALLRENVSKSIKLFPDNTIFLSIFAWNEARSRIGNHVRSIMRDVVLRERQDTGTVIGWMFAIWTELNSMQSGGRYNVHALRATFERAVASRTGKSNPALWKAFLEFEHEQKDLGRAKSVFYRGLRNCPWSKEFSMLAFQHLHDYLGSDELHGIYKTIVEKELRIHVDLEKALDEMNEAGTLQAPSHRSRLAITLPNDVSSGGEDED